MAGLALEIGVLGTLEVRRDGALIELPAGRPSVLVAVLALRVGSVVPHSVLAGYLWPEVAPANPRRTIQTYAARMRAVLGGDSIRSRRDGLVLDIAPQQVDVFRFRALAGAGGADGLATAHLERLRQALALWRGAPLSGLSPDALEHEHAPALVEELLGVTERANELRIEHNLVDDELVGSLRRLIAVHPWRERLWGQLMRSLYRRGRQGEALSTYHELVGVLRDDLGIEPGVELTRLHQQILTTDPGLDRATSGAAVATSRIPRPAQLPAGTPDFVGRAGELDMITSALTGAGDRVRLAVVSGAAGMGKTTLALQAAHRVRDHFPDGQLFAYLSAVGAPVAAHDVLAGFLRALGVDAGDVPASTAERAALFRSVCAGRRVLVVVDDVRSVDQLVPLMPGAPGCAVVVTSRPQVPLPTDARVDLGVLSDLEARDLLSGIIGAERFAAEPEAIAQVLQACGGSPLAVRIAGGRLATRPSWPIQHLADRLAGANRLDELHLGGHGVRTALDATFRSLEPELARRFEQLAVLPCTVVDLASAAIVWGVGSDHALDSLEELCDVRLIEPAAPGLYRWHDLVRDFMRAMAVPTTDGDAERRLVRHAIRSLVNAKEVVRADDRPHHAVITSIGDVGGEAFADRAAVHDWIHPRFLLFGCLARRQLAVAKGEAVSEAAAMTVLLDVVTDECCRADSVCEDALRAVIDADVPPAAAHFTAAAWHNLGVVLSDQGRLTEAHEAGRHAVHLWRSLDDRYGELVMLNNMGMWHHQLHEYDKALELLLTCVGAGDVVPAPLLIRCMYNLADVYVHLGELEQARHQLAAADAIGRPEPFSLGAHREAIVRTALHRAEGRTADAIAANEHAFAVAEGLGSTSLQSGSMVVMARTLRHFDLDSSAVAADAVRRAQQGHHLRIQAEALLELGHAHHRLGELDAAAGCWHDARAMFDSLGLGDELQVRAWLAETSPAAGGLSSDDTAVKQL